MNITTKQIEEELITYLKKGNPNIDNLKVIPKDISLVEQGYMDSFAIVDLVTYFENKWEIEIQNHEISVENFGSINKMIKFIESKII